MIFPRSFHSRLYEVTPVEVMITASRKRPKNRWNSLRAHLISLPAVLMSTTVRFIVAVLFASEKQKVRGKTHSFPPIPLTEGLLSACEVAHTVKLLIGQISEIV
jgi:hypothetical protein